MVLSSNINKSHNTAQSQGVKNYISFTLRHIIKTRINVYVILTLKPCSFYSIMFGLISAMLWRNIAFTIMIITITIIIGVLIKLKKLVIMSSTKTMQ